MRGPNWIGDAVMCEPAVAALRGLFPSAEIALLVKPAIAELYRGHQGVDRLVIYDDRGKHAGWSGKWRLADELRRSRFDLAVLFQNAFEAALLAWLAGIPKRVGYATDARSVLLTDPLARPDRRRPPHQVAYYWNLLRPFGLNGEPPAPRLHLSHDEVAQAGARLGAGGIGPSDCLIGVNPGSTYGGAKRWLPERFAEAVALAFDGLKRQGRAAQIVIVGAKGEEELGRTIAEDMRRRTGASVTILSGQTGIRELMAVVARCQAFVTNDTGPMHVAAALGVPTVAVFGPTDHRTTAPYGGACTIVRRPVDCAPCLLRECPIDHRCMTGVTAEEVSEALMVQMAVEGGGAPQECGQAERSLGSDGRGMQSFGPADRSPHRAPLDGVTIFLDRDGTLNRDSSYIKTPEELVLLPGVVDTLAALKRAGARLVVITNQSGIARGFFTAETLKAIHAKLVAEVEAGGGTLDALYYCPHHPDDGCACRKPNRAMVDRAVEDLGVGLARAYVIGDQQRDIQLGHRLGARTVLVTTGPTSLDALHMLQREGTPPHAVAADFAQAGAWIVQDCASRSREIAGPPPAVTGRDSVAPLVPGESGG